MFHKNIVLHVKQQVQMEGRRHYRIRAAGTCSKCGNDRGDVTGRYCRPCRAAYNRARNAKLKKQFTELKALAPRLQQQTDGADNGQGV